MTWQEFYRKWQGGCGSPQCSRPATRVCLARGNVPCTVLFVGEGPGPCENAKGRPFEGPAGLLMQRIIEDALPPRMSYALTNLVGCYPRNEQGVKDEPGDEQISCCKQRLEEFIALCEPLMIVAVGRIANDYLEQGQKWSLKLPACVRKVVHITHPSNMQRQNEAVKGFMLQEAAVIIETALDTAGILT